MLAAYRRDDWPTADLAAFSRHLASCADCRRAEVDYRRTGEMIRHLPSITPPPEFREAVFAAIRAEERRLAPEVARLSRAATNPELPVIRPASRPPRPVRVRLAPRVALVAAALLLSLVTAKVLPMLDPSMLDRAATRLASGPAPTVARYPVDARYSVVTGAVATGAWLVYSAADASRGAMLFARDRHSGRVAQLLATPSRDPLAVRAVTDRWAIWSVGSGMSSARWSLRAAALTESSGADASLTLVDGAARGADTPVTLGGVWAEGDTALVAGATAAGRGVLLRVDLAGGRPAARVIARSSAPGHLFTDPSAAGSSAYWADVWYDRASGLHSAIWRDDDAGQRAEVSQDDASFHPQIAGTALVWVDVSQRALANMAAGTDHSPDGDELLMGQLNGALEARDLISGQQWEVSPRADVDGVQAQGNLLVWHSDARTHAYDLAARRSLAVDGQLGAAVLAGCSATSLVWMPSDAATLDVYDAA
jgi:hypothetical protein